VFRSKRPQRLAASCGAGSRRGERAADRIGIGIAMAKNKKGHNFPGNSGHQSVIGGGLIDFDQS